jgi:hypothetical protein
VSGNAEFFNNGAAPTGSYSAAAGSGYITVNYASPLPIYQIGSDGQSVIQLSSNLAAQISSTAFTNAFNFFEFAQSQPHWQFTTFAENSSGFPSAMFACVGLSPTNLVSSPFVVYTDPFNRSLRDSSIVRWNGQFIAFFTTLYNNANLYSPTNGFSVATSTDGLRFSYLGMIAFATNVVQWAPEPFVDATNNLHLLAFVQGNNAVQIADISPTNLLQALNIRTISGITGTDPFMVFTNNTYFLFTSTKEWASASMDSGFTAIATSSSPTYEGSTVFFYGTNWVWLKSNDAPYPCVTSLDLTNWSASADWPWTPNNPVKNYYGFQQGTMSYFDSSYFGAFTGNGSGLTSLNATSLTGILPITDLPGMTTNVSVSGLTFYITNGLIMRVSTP